jgi:hypothetical protein
MTSNQQLSEWWSRLSPSNQALVSNRPVRSVPADASYFCEAIAGISDKFGTQAVVDTLAPLAVPIIASWEEKKLIAEVDDTNTAASIAAKGNKGKQELRNLRRGQLF